MKTSYKLHFNIIWFFCICPYLNDRNYKSIYYEKFNGFVFYYILSNIFPLIFLPQSLPCSWSSFSPFHFFIIGTRQFFLFLRCFLCKQVRWIFKQMICIRLRQYYASIIFKINFEQQTLCKHILLFEKSFLEEKIVDFK